MRRWIVRITGESDEDVATDDARKRRRLRKYVNTDNERQSRLRKDMAERERRAAEVSARMDQLVENDSFVELLQKLFDDRL